MRDFIKELKEMYGTEAQHIINHFQKIGTNDIQELEKQKQTGKWIVDGNAVRFILDEDTGR